MVTVYRAHGLRFVIYPNDHDPAHIHVIGDGELKVNIHGLGGLPELVWSVGMKITDRRNAMDVVRDRQEELMAHWYRLTGEEA